jgi:outer membrane protein TolC
MRKFILILISLLIINPVFAQGSQEIKPATALSLKDAVSCALQNNNELRALKSSLSAQQREIGIAKSDLMPKLRFDEIFTSTNNPALDFALRINQRNFTSADLANAPNSFNKPDAINNFLTAVTLEQPLYVRKSFVGLDMAKTEYSAKTYEFFRKQEEVAFNISKTYLSAITAQQYVYVSQKGVSDAKEHLRIAQVRFKTGLGLYSDVLRTSTAVTEAEQKLVSANKNLNLAKRSLGLLMGEKTSVEINGQTPQLSLKNIDYENTALLSRNDIKFMEMRVENAKNGIKFANADYLPEIHSFGSYQLYDHRAPFAAEGNNYTAGANLRWDVFDGNKTKYQKLQAKDRVTEAQEYLEGMKKNISYKIYEACSNVEEAKKNLELANSALKTAEEGKRLVLKRWENSLSPMVDLLDAQVNLDKARADVVKTTNDYKSALISLSFESGILFKDLGI